MPKAFVEDGMSPWRLQALNYAIGQTTTSASPFVMDGGPPDRLRSLFNVVVGLINCLALLVTAPQVTSCLKATVMGRNPEGDVMV